MKKIVMAVGIVMALTSCGGATDGNPKTDTTSMPVDTNTVSGSSQHVNEAHGMEPIDSSKRQGLDSVRK